MENTEKRSDKGYKITIAILLLIIAALTWQLVTTKIQVKTIIVEKTKEITKATELQSELDALMAEHEKIKKEYSSLSNKLSEKDKIILDNAAEIQRLIASQSDYRKIKRKLELLRGITQGYVHQIDSLFTVNKVLKDENVKIKGDYQKEQNKNEELVKDKDILNTKVTQASVLKAYNITSVGIKTKSNGKKEIDADKAKRVDKIKVCFTLSENLIIPSGKKTIYVRIARPDNLILTKGSGDAYSFEANGTKLQYSLKQEIDYQNKAQNLCMYWEKADKKAEAMTGRYYVTVFADGIQIGESSFELK
ncbi:MAG: hypothetical protein HXX09_13345 [Bacteroidetes bacterium]|nr:hypothetical protein [Bacteroidota bacterium]